MAYAIDETHDPKLESWVESANDPNTDFPIQNLPLCRFAPPYEMGSCNYFGIRIGSKILDIEGLAEKVPLIGEKAGSVDADIFGCNNEETLLSWMHEPFGRKFRKTVQFILSTEASAQEKKIVSEYLHDAESCDFMATGVINLRDYTDFYASLYHATNVGSMFRPDNPLLPNYKHIPIGYHGRASSIVPSGTAIRRPVGQQAPAEEGGQPGFGPCKLLDYEMEMGLIIGRGNNLGEPISIEDAEDHMLGMCILNDWSARDLQKWEYVPLGPFLAKNFASTVSPYIVTMEALAPFRVEAMERDASDPQPLPYMDSEANRKMGGFDITLEVHIASKQMRDKGMDPVRLSRGNFRDMYWTLAQMVTHHTVNGCNLQPGDLLGSGTVSGTARDARGSMLELTWDGDPFANPPVLVPGTQRTPIVLPTGEERKFIADGDEIIMKAYCQREGFRRIGFGECRGIIEPALKV